MNMHFEIETEEIKVLSDIECNNINSVINKNIKLEDNNLEKENFKNTTSFAFSYNVFENIEYIYKKNGMEILYIFFKNNIEDDFATEYFFNLFSIKNNDNNDEYIVGPHCDSSLSKVASKVFVLYIKVPEDLNGGELELFEDNGNRIIKPETGKLIKFSGSTRHAIKNMKCKRDDYRLSAVWEVYY